MAHMNTCLGHQLPKAILNHFCRDGKKLLRVGPGQPLDIEEVPISAKGNNFCRLAGVSGSSAEDSEAK